MDELKTILDEEIVKAERSLAHWQGQVDALRRFRAQFDSVAKRVDHYAGMNEFLSEIPQKLIRNGRRKGGNLDIDP